MCVYCMVADHMWKFDPPWPHKDLQPAIQPLVPQPVTPGPHVPWDLQRLIEYRDLLKEIRELEAKVGCPCEPNKADYLALFDEQIAAMQKKRDELAQRAGA